MARSSRSGARVTVDRAAARRVVVEASYRVSRRAAERTRDRVRENIAAKGRINTGAMMASVHATHLRTTATGAQYGIVISGPAAGYFMFQDQGTRAHGPKTAKVLRFKPKGSNTFVFAQWVRGVEPGNFISDAYRSIRAGDYL